MKNLLLVFILFFNISVFFAQNLVPDPGFELSTMQLDNTWERTYGTVDLFDNALDSFNAGHFNLLPNTHIINLNPRNGNRVLGAIFTHFDERRMSESAHIRLSSPLKSDAIYKIEMHTRLDKHHCHPMEYIPILFTKDTPNKKIGNVKFAALKGKNKLLNQKSSWEKVTGYYKATGGEQYLLIGNFKNANYTQLYENSNRQLSTYYFFDDVSVTLSEKAQPEITTVQNLKPVSKFHTQTPIELTFQTAQTDITQTYQDTMHERLAFLKSNPNITLVIEGHTDNVGSSDYNQVLSKKRAEEAAQFFIKNGIEENRLKIIGYGEAQPIANNQTEKGRQKNRRVTIDFEVNTFNEFQQKALRDFTKLYGYFRYFHPSMEVQNIDWNEFAVFGVHQIRKCNTQEDCRSTLLGLFHPIAPTAAFCFAENQNCIAPIKTAIEKAIEKNDIKYWEYDGLGGGNRTYAHQLVNNQTKERFFNHLPTAHTIKGSFEIGGSYEIPIVIPNFKRGQHLIPFKNLLQKVDEATFFREDMYFGNTIIAWNLVQHFYPYFDELPQLDWDKKLTQSLTELATVHTDEAFYKFLQEFSVSIQDGHSKVGWDALPKAIMWLPFEVELANNQFVVSRTGTKGIEVGDIILEVDKQPAMKMFQQDTALISGTSSWKKGEGLTGFGAAKQYSTAKIKLKRGNNTRTIEVIRDWADYDYFIVKELKDDIYYVKLTDIGNIDTVLHYLPELTSAKGIIWDIRGYLYNNFTKLLAHFITEPDTVKWLASPGILLPNQKDVVFDWQGWDLQPNSPTIQVPMIFLTNGKAISASESFMMFIDHYDIGTIIGEPTAGANGSRNWQSLYGGFRFHWTGMKVTHFDGRPFHNQGVQPDILVYPKYEDLIKGKDTVLETAIELLDK